VKSPFMAMRYPKTANTVRNVSCIWHIKLCWPWGRLVESRLSSAVMSTSRMSWKWWTIWVYVSLARMDLPLVFLQTYLMLRLWPYPQGH
jgi:hypothetical protein